MFTHLRLRTLPLFAAVGAACLSLTSACSSTSSVSASSSASTSTISPAPAASPPAQQGTAGTSGIAPIPASELSPAGTFGQRPTVTAPSGAPPTQLESADLIVGTGATAQAGQTVTVQYDGYSWTTKKEFDASWNRGQTFNFPLGRGQVIQGWDQGVAGMKVGGRRELVIPPNLAYGSQSPSPDIAANDTLIFVVDLISVG